MKDYFQVTTVDVIKRYFHALIPFNPNFHDISDKSPDLYGPFWIYTTLIFIIAAAGSINQFLLDKPGNGMFFSKFVPIAAGLVNFH